MHQSALYAWVECIPQSIEGMEPSQDNKIEDCIGCKVIGVCTFGGISAYAAKLFVSTPKSNRTQRIFLSCMGLGALSVAAVRLFD